MALYVPNEGEVYALTSMLKSAEVLTLRLGTAGTPSDTCAFATFTEATGMGYAGIPLVAGSWTIATDGSNNTDATYPEQTFTFTAGAGMTITCYYVTTSTNKVVWAEPLSPTAAIPVGGGSIKLTLKLRLD